MYALIDGAVIHSRAALHDSLMEQLDLPEYYGRNLDALFDCLTELEEPCEIVVRNVDEMYAYLGVYAERLQDVSHQPSAASASPVASDRQPYSDDSAGRWQQCRVHSETKPS